MILLSALVSISVIFNVLYVSLLQTCNPGDCQYCFRCLRMRPPSWNYVKAWQLWSLLLWFTLIVTLAKRWPMRYCQIAKSNTLSKVYLLIPIGQIIFVVIFRLVAFSIRWHNAHGTTGITRINRFYIYLWRIVCNLVVSRLLDLCWTRD